MSTFTLNTFFQIILLFCIFIFTIAAFSNSGEARRNASKINLRGTSKLEADFFQDLKRGELNEWSLADAFFIASGIREQSQLNRARQWYDRLVDEAKEILKPYKKADERADQLLRWLHKRVFRTYKAQATDAFDIIKTGKFNCLSSCIMYGMIGEKLGLHVRGITVDQHAFCRVYSRPLPKRITSTKSRSGGWDVETTTALGFNPGRTVQIDRAVISVPRSRYRNRKEISLLEMVGLIYTNHVGMTRAYPSHEDRLLAYQKAHLFFPRDQIIKHNILAAHTQVIQGYAKRRRWQGAQAFLEQLADFDHQDKYLTTLWMQVAEQHLDHASYKGLEVALKELKNYQELAQSVPKSTWYYLEAQLYGRAASHLDDRSRSDEADQYFNKACLIGQKAQSQRNRGSLSSRQAIKRLRHNYLVLVKNYIIKVFNQRNLSRAKKLISIALKTNSSDRDLRQLKQKIFRN
ncbi:MAG: hypothetical protein CMH49_01280 [Myxococcales bacterium]|nr:hypothetical protein [Myxococcales bacterium]